MTLFSCKNIGAGYGTRRIIDDISFTIDAGSLTGLLGANGCGKTTLIRAVGCILPHEGSCTLNGQQMEALKPRQLARLCSYIPQRSGISIDLSLLDVVLMGFNAQLGLLEHPGPEMREQAMAALREVGLAQRADESYLNLSEGQKQLCILARTLVSGGKMLLLDEPESALDFSHRYAVLELVKRWLQREDRCALVALHDPQLALNLCDQLVLMKAGRIAAVLHPRRDGISDMELALREIYGGVQLLSCRDRSGNAHLVMLKEDNT